MKTALFLLATLLLEAPASAQVAYDHAYTGHLEQHNQVEYLTIPIHAGLGNLRVWTDSYADSANFDPVITVWHNGIRIAMNDDDPTFTSFQTSRDAGIYLPTLTWGSYVVTLTAYPNFPVSNYLENGFTYDSQRPLPFDTWCQPGDPGPGCNTARHFSLHWTID